MKSEYKEEKLTKNIFTLFLDKLLVFPLWVKQVIFFKLYNNLRESLSENFIALPENHIFHLYIPTITFVGRTELSDRKGNLDNNIYIFLENVSKEFNIIEIAMNNFWTMEEVAKYFIDCVDASYLKMPEIPDIYAMAGFMSGKFRTGEYFKRVGKVTVDQLEKAILRQKECNAKGQNVKFAEVMISLGYVTEKDTSSLLIIKEEAKKRFILDANVVPAMAKEQSLNLPNSATQAELDHLKEENKLLKEKLAKILAFVKKND